MLVSFSVKNFRSFYEETQISMVANGRLNQLKDHTVAYDGIKLLRGGYVYGANASGKTNLIKAVDFAQKIIESGSTSSIRYANQYCKMYKEARQQPGVFQFEIVIDGLVYVYGFALSYKDGQIVEEWLYELPFRGDEKCIFARDSKGEITDGLGLKGNVATRFKIYSEDLRSLPRDLFLAELAKKPVQEKLKIFNQVYEWFKRLIVIYPASKYRPLPFIMDDEDVRGQFEKHLKYFDTGINAIGVETTTLEAEFGHLPNGEMESFQHYFAQKLAEQKGVGAGVIRGPGMLLVLRRENDDEIVVRKLTLKHGDAAECFDLVEESDGTQRLFDLVPLLFGELENRVVFIDEIDRNMHPKLTVEFVERFYEYTRGQNMQIIATTHESALLDLNRVRRDEIWFVEKSPTGSKLFSLDDFQVRYDKKIEKDYLLGRFGAIPFFSAFDLLSERVSENGQT